VYLWLSRRSGSSAHANKNGERGNGDKSENRFQGWSLQIAVSLLLASPFELRCGRQDLSTRFRYDDQRLLKIDRLFLDVTKVRK
jgi:hypothetical protein